jgi:hypothetical protein
MARQSLPRSTSSTSTLSCITVENDVSVALARPSSTPPTSVTDSGSISYMTIKDEEQGSAKRGLRSRASITSYNENVLAGTTRIIRRKTIEASVTNTSDESLVPMDGASRQLMEESIQVLNLDWSVDALPSIVPEHTEPNRKSFRQRMSMDTSLLKKASDAMGKTTSVLGKRGRDAVDASLGRLQELGRRASLRARIQVQEPAKDHEAPQEKKAKISDPDTTIKVDPTPETTRKPVKAPTKKRWLTQGLYVGQDPDFDPRMTDARNKQRRARKSTESKTKQRSILPLPMFAGKRLIENGRPFQLPWDVFSPLPPGQPKPEEWRKVHKSKESL